MSKALSAFILSLLLSEPDPKPHPLEEDAELRETVADDFIAAGEKWEQDPFDLAYWSWRESRLRPEAIGKHPNPKGKVVRERGICQVHGKARKTCEAAGLDLETYTGGAECLALLLRMGRGVCKTDTRARGWYMSGSCNKAIEKATRRHNAGRRRACPFRGGVWDKRKKKCLKE